MVTDWNSLYKDFTKSELVEIASELGIETKGETTSKVLVKKIMDNLESEGVPETDQCSTLMLEYLCAAEITDEDGNLLGEVEVDAKKEEAAAPKENMPPCYGFEDDRDPACKKCKVASVCKTTRIESRPACFGKLYAEHDENCAACIEAPFCKIEVLETKAKFTVGSKKGSRNG